MNMPYPKLLTHCPLCQTPYEDSSIHLLGEDGAARLFHLTCARCSHSVLAVILENQSGISSVGLVTDLEAQDAVRFRDAEPITADDMLFAHKSIESGSREVCKCLLHPKK
jgi:hypothetical protein